MTDYYQPDFYHFSEDSLKLADFIDKLSFDKGAEVLEVGAGSGVISIELMLSNPLLKVALVEMQEAFYEPLRKNLKLFNKKADIYMCDFLTVNLNKKFDVIYTNPPYFFKESSRESLSVEKDICRRMERDNWGFWLSKIRALLRDEGFFVFCHRDGEGLFSEGLWRVEKKIKLEKLYLYVLKVRS